MKRELKKMYTEMILDAIINDEWDKHTYDNYGLIDFVEVKFVNNPKTVGKFRYKFEFTTEGVFSKYIHVSVDKGDWFSQRTDTLTYNIFSPIYWRIEQMKKDHLNSNKIAETNIYMDTYKEFKQSVAQRDIAQIEQSLANLAKAEQEQKQMLEELRGKQWTKADTN